MAIIVKEFVGKGNIKKIDEKITKTTPKKTTKKIQKRLLKKLKNNHIQRKRYFTMIERIYGANVLVEPKT